MTYRLPAIGAALGFVALLQPYRLFVVSGDSMSPTFASGQILLADIHPRDLSRGDVVVFHHGDETMVKRVAYLPGDSIDRFWFIGEWKLPTSRKTLQLMLRRGLPRQHYTVPPGHVYVLSDNPYGSIDSRTYGPIPDEAVVAVVPNVDASAQFTLDSAKLGSTLAARL